MKLDAHTKSSAKHRKPGIVKLAKTYNNLCKELTDLKRQGKAPRNAIVPDFIETHGLFDLDIDDNIWQDVGLDDASQGPIPPWMGDNDVREGIKVLLEHDRCLEEESRLRRERSAMQEWLREEWDSIQLARAKEGKSSFRCQAYNIQ